MKGCFVRADGRLFPNLISAAGAELILRNVFHGDAFTLYAGLATGVPAYDMIESDFVEPTVGVSGYDRIALDSGDNTHWPTVGNSNQMKYIESKPLVFAPSAAFDQPIQRIVLFTAAIATPAADVFSASGLLPAEVILDENTDLVDRTFTYRLYL